MHPFSSFRQYTPSITIVHKIGYYTGWSNFHKLIILHYITKKYWQKALATFTAKISLVWWIYHTISWNFSLTGRNHPGVCRLFELCAWTSAGQTLEAKNEAESSRYDCGSTDRQDGRMVISHFRSVEYWSRTFTFIFLRLSIFNDCWCNRCAAQLTNRPSSSPTTIVFTY